MQIAIINYQIGNIRSVANAFEIVSNSVEIITKPEDLSEAERVVLPGVGSYEDGMQNLERLGWINVLEEEVIKNNKPFLGICLGMQMLGTHSTENGYHKGLNWISGDVKKISVPDKSYRIPHIGWNNVHIPRNSRLFDNLGDTPDFYFVHSYALCPDDHSVISATCDYGVNFVAAVERENICGTQFHPEKSQKSGLALLKNFLKM